MTKEAVILILLVGAAAVGILYVIRKASSNEEDWAQYQEVHLGDAYGTVRSRFSSASEDLRTNGDARASGYLSSFKEATNAGATRMFIVPTREDSFMFGFDKEDRLVYKNFRDN
jgi:hypothetical protein